MANTLEITLDGASIGVRATSEAGVGQFEYYPLANIASVTGVREDDIAILSAANQKKNKYLYEDMLIVNIELIDLKHANIRFDIQSVTNQPTWTSDPTGLTQAINDIRDFLATASPGAPAIGTPVTVDTTGTHTIPIGAFEIGVQNLGTGDADVDGVAFPSGSTIDIRSQIDTAIDLDGLTTERLFINYLT